MTAFTDACDRLLEKITAAKKAGDEDAQRRAEYQLAELMCEGLPPEPLDVRMIAAEGRGE